MANKAILSKETIDVLKRMEPINESTGFKYVPKFNTQSEQVEISFQTSGVTVENTWTIKDINKMVKN